MFIGTKIKEIRSLKKMTRQEMADKLDISVTAYGKIEQDNTDPNFSRLQQIADVFDMSVTDLVGYGEKLTQINGDNSPSSQNINLFPSDVALTLENEKFKMQVSFLEKRIKDLEEINNLLKNKQN